jgi:signal transduction histidine kinase
MIGNYDTGSGVMLDITSDQRIFLADKALAMYDKIKNDPKSQMLKKHVEIVRLAVTAERMSLEAAERFEVSPLNEKWAKDTFRQIQFSGATSYGIPYKIADKQMLAIVSEEYIAEMWNSAIKELQDEIVFCKVFDDTGKFVAGKQWDYAGAAYATGESFLTFEPGEYFKGWKVEVYFREGVFGDTAKRTRLAYGWTAALVIGFMILIGGFAVKSVLHQAAVNRLKNDFVATVTHELKTPLASMRVLVDTLLEGNYNDQQQAKEYLELIAKENKRLTGLIDNFLTFSRMERNKQAFEIVPVSAKTVAQAAADAVRTKFNGGTCKFIVTIDDGLASISVDTDAMVTVLVNLLDNAYKYSGDEKQIELSVYDENGQVCFAVKDDGIGMSNRAQKKIFERFYQVDSRLSRDAEGCGLGLSIVKFIVDAHDGTIEVDSETDKGSTFIVKIPSA